MLLIGQPLADVEAAILSLRNHYRSTTLAFGDCLLHYYWRVLALLRTKIGVVFILNKLSKIIRPSTRERAYKSL